ncbi:regulator of nonsense transcripts 2 isoform X1 [Brachionus plicatilis]|uniref:Regulator of nonsense transcripts 2 isoform X1 n=1 Tax=Brachionus plicatilis TaxID=10195 RepID=A0A3M7R4Z0_BRAPC|nr:regulator of nonsense transcripts 2 isoform X1 [Brachionus plicatilis]
MENETNSDNQTEQELASLNQYIREKEDRLRFKQDLRQKNQNVEGARLDDAVLKRLDSSIKKVTSFIKKLKTLTESQKDSLNKDMSQLNLSKYLSEVGCAFLEAKLKMNDVQCALILCSQMHRSYADFSNIFFEQWQKVLNLKKDGKIQNPSKLRVDLRFFADLISIGVLPEKESLSLLGNQLTILTTCDKEHSHISIVSSFCKHCGEDFADLVPLKYEKMSLKHNIQIPRSTIYSNDRQKAVKCLFKEYFMAVSKHLVTEHKEMQRIEAQNMRIYQTKGELHSDKKEKYEQAFSAYRKLSENSEVLADLLAEQMPHLPNDQNSKKEDGMLNIDVYTPTKGEDFDANSSPWEDEETRQFYESLPHIKSLIPEILYKESATAAKSAPEAKSDNESGAQMGGQMGGQMGENERGVASGDEEVSGGGGGGGEFGQDEEQDEANKESQVQEKSVSSANMKALMDSFINQLPNCVSRELIDKAAKDYCMNLNSKVNRKRLTRALFEVQRTRLDLLPFYARFVAALNPLMAEIATDLATLLLNDFRYQVRKKDQINIESKIKVSRYIGELVKFNMLPKAEALNCLKTLLADFRHHNIEMFCNLVEVCGRFLYRNAETHIKMNLLLEILMRKKQAAMSMDSRYTIMIENAFYYCNPPDNKQVEKKAPCPLHEYVKKILYKELNKLCVERVLRQMRKLDWHDQHVKSMAIQCLTSASNVRYNSIHCLANLVSGLALYYEDIGIQIVDAVIEDIRLGLEINLAKFNQRRVSMVKYLAELYNYRMVESSIIFKTLYTLITFGVSYDLNELIANADTCADPLDNYFRIRLVCTLLDTCGQYFDRGSTKKKLDCYLIYFQRYYMFKKEFGQSVDIARPYDRFDIEFVFTDIISSLRPEFKFANTYEQACEQVSKMEGEIRDSIVQAKKETVCKEDDEFLKAFESMVTETIAQRTKETIKMPTVDISVPMCARKPKTAQVQEVNELSGLSMLKEKQPSGKEASTDTGKETGTEARKEAFNFVLMLKKGNKTQYQNMQVPVTSEFATQFKAKEQLEKAEKEKLKQLTLNINDRIEQEEFQEMVQQQSTQKQSMLGNTNRDRFKYNHPKGAPDADQIFGTSSQRTYRGYTK